MLAWLAGLAFPRVMIAVAREQRQKTTVETMMVVLYSMRKSSESRASWARGARGRASGAEI